MTSNDHQKDTLQKLSQYFRQLPDPILAKLTLAIELDRLKDDGDAMLPHEQLLTILRPFVARSGSPVPRVPTPMRLFCDPFEDLIYVGKNPHKLPGRILRPSLTPVWNWLSHDLIPDSLPELERTIRAQILSGNRDELEKQLTKLHKVAGLAITDALKGITPDSKAWRDLASTVGSTRALEDARDISVALRSARHITEIKRSFAEHIENLDYTARDQAKDFFHALNGWSGEGADLVLYLLMGRLNEPWNILSLAREIDEESNRVSGENSTFAKTLNILVDDFDQLSDYLREIDLTKANIDEVVAEITTFTQLGNTLERELQLAPTITWPTDLRKKKSDVSRLIELHLERTPEAILSAIPTLSLGNFGAEGAARPDLSQWPDDAKRMRAVSEAAFLDGLHKLASKAAFGTVYNDVLERMEATVHRYAENIVQEIRASTGEDREKAQAYFETAVELTRQISGESEAILLQRRVEAALS